MSGADIVYGRGGGHRVPEGYDPTAWRREPHAFVGGDRRRSCPRCGERWSALVHETMMPTGCDTEEVGEQLDLFGEAS